MGSNRRLQLPQFPDRRPRHDGRKPLTAYVVSPLHHFQKASPDRHSALFCYRYRTMRAPRAPSVGPKKGSNMKTTLRQNLLASTLLVGASAFASPAFAQDTAPVASDPTGPVEAAPTPTVSAEGEDVQSGQDIIVTGSRIPQPNLESAAPVTVVSDQDVKLSGSTRIEDVLNQLPSAGAAQVSGVSNGA